MRFDQRGCGQSEGPRQWIDRFTDYADDVQAIVQWSDANLPKLPLVLLGHSLGGAVTITAAAALPPDRLAAVVLLAPAYIPGAGVSPAKIFIGKLLERVWPRLEIPGSLDVTAVSRDPGVVDAYRKDSLNCSFNTVRQGNEILRALPALPELCRKIKAPALIAHGARDRLVKPEGSSTLLRALGSADKKLEIFPECFHELHNDLDKDAFFRTLGGWLDERFIKS